LSSENTANKSCGKPGLARISQCAVKGAVLQWVKFPPRQGDRAAPPGIESWTYGGNDMSKVAMMTKVGNEASPQSLIELILN